MKINKEWHEKNRMPPSPSIDERVKWHIAHKKHCACRPIPKDVQKELERRGIYL